VEVPGIAGTSPITTMPIVTTKPAAKERRPVFVLELRPEPGIDPVLALRALLKVTLRRFGMRCISAHESRSER